LETKPIDCCGSPGAVSFCGKLATVIACPVSGATPWFCCAAHAEGAPTKWVAEWFRLQALGADKHRVRTCDICAHQQICDKYSDWTCAKCGQEYVYDETTPKIVLTAAQRAILRFAVFARARQ